MKKYSNFYIDGQWVAPVEPKYIDVINPATEAAFAEVALGSAADVDRAVKAARKAFDSYSQTPVKERLALLARIAEVYESRYDEMAQTISQEMGAPITMATTQQAAVGLGHIRTAHKVLKNYTFEHIHEGNTIRKEAIGVCGLITPWNWPINQIASKLGSALAAGCTVILKPSEIAPLSAILLTEILDEAGVPKGVFNLLQGYGPEVGEAMSAHPDIDMMSFTGSTRGGIAVAKTSAETVKRIAQELGGKSPHILLDDDSLGTNVFKGVQFCMSNTGQSCNAPTRMLVPAHRRAEIAEHAIRAIEKLKVGDPTNPETDLGPLVSEAQFDKVQKLIQKGIDEGATLVAGGVGRPEGLDTGYYSRSTVFADVDNTMTIAREEIFGPVISIISYDSEEEAVAIANDTEFGLAAYVSGEDRASLERIARKLRAGQVHINMTGGGTDSPFGGYKQSGNGREKTIWGLEEYLETKAICG